MLGRTRLAALGIGALAIAGCGSSKTRTVTVNQPAASSATSAATTPAVTTPTETTPAATTPAATTTTASSGSNHGKLGDTLTVKGQTKDVIAVTAKDVQDPAHGYDPDAGKRVVGVHFTVKNVGKVVYKDFPSAQVTTADGESSGSAISVGGSCSSPSTIKLKPGDSKSFCLPFQVAKAGKLKTVQYEPDAGYGTPAVFAVK
jgi:uncharacterized cupredoxin-like copper-binding protein